MLSKNIIDSKTNIIATHIEIFCIKFFKFEFDFIKEGKIKINTPIKYIMDTNLFVKKSNFYYFLINSLINKSPCPLSTAS